MAGRKKARSAEFENEVKSVILQRLQNTTPIDDNQSFPTALIFVHPIISVELGLGLGQSESTKCIVDLWYWL
jgi:hypothetical protein